MALDAPLALDTIVFARGLSTSPETPPALDGIDLDILPGEIFTIVGRAGSGTTTLLEALVGLQPVSAAQFTVCGADPRQFSRTVKERIGVAPKRVAVERKMTVDEVLRLFAGFYQRGDAERVLRLLNLTAVRSRTVESLAPDPAQRLSIALALVNRPTVLFADEPTRDLDPDSSRIVWDILRDRRERGRTSVITTNRLDEAASLSDRVAIIHGGRLIAADTPAALMARSRAPVNVTFELLKPQVSIETAMALDAVLDVQMDRSQYTLVSSDGRATLRAVMRLLETEGLHAVTLAMRQQTIEDVFLSLTSERGNAAA
jgi:ABC-2 type transport system ATP-binding protein